MRLKPKFKPNLAPVPRGPRVRKISESTTAGDAAAAARRIRHGYFHDIIFLQISNKGMIFILFVISGPSRAVPMPV